MYSTHIASKSVVAEMFIKTLKSEIYKTMTHNKKFYLGYLNKLVDEYNNTYHLSIGKKSIDADFSALTKEIATLERQGSIQKILEIVLIA